VFAIIIGCVECLPSHLASSEKRLPADERTLAKRPAVAEVSDGLGGSLAGKTDADFIDGFPAGIDTSTSDKAAPMSLSDSGLSRLIVCSVSASASSSSAPPGRFWSWQCWPGWSAADDIFLTKSGKNESR
jgi:hypothetical protein